MSGKIEKRLGTLYGKNSMFFHERMGTATSENESYEMWIVNGLPAIHNMDTGKTFLFDWAELLIMAKKAGV